MRTLSIGNSFSEDACGYLHQIADSLEIDLECVNLYIGGCSLEYHADNLAENRQNYDLQINGGHTGRKIGIHEALTTLGEFDVITLQQASHFSGIKDTYFPYVKQLYDACRKYQPNAKIMLHQTWAYEQNSSHPAFGENYKYNQRYMYECLREAYSDTARELGVGLIPVGDTVQYFRENIPEFDFAAGGVSLNRDGFHISIPLGRCLIAYVWIETLIGADVRKSNYIPAETDENTASLFPLVREKVHEYISDLRR